MVRIANRRCLRLLAAQYLPPCGPGQQLAGQCRFTIRSARGDSATHSRSLTRRRSQSFDRASSDRCRPICRACSDGYGQRGRTVLDRCRKGIEQCRTPGTVLVGRSGDEVVTSRADRDISSSHRNIRTRRRGGWVRNQGGPGRADLDVDQPEPLRGGAHSLGASPIPAVLGALPARQRRRPRPRPRSIHSTVTINSQHCDRYARARNLSVRLAGGTARDDHQGRRRRCRSRGHR